MNNRPEKQELEKVKQELEFRTTITSAMIGTLDLEQILYAILCGITSGDGLGFNRAFLFLDDDARRYLRVTLAVGPSSAEEARVIWDNIVRDNLTLPVLLDSYQTFRHDPSMQNLSKKMADFQLPLNELESLAASPQAMLVQSRAPLVGAMARCLISNTPFASNAMTLVHEVGGASGELMEFSKVAIAPLSASHRLIGSILADNIYTGNEVDPEDLRRLHGLGNLAAVAIDRARLHAKTVAMAEVDGLTGVYNRRYYQQELERILEITRRSRQILTIVIFDLDHFKLYNDTHGHLVGDELLKEIAQLLQQHIRQGDLIARYGGEEFVVLLADTKPEPAVQVAEKLRQLVKQTPLTKRRISGLTLSAGVASTRGADSAEQLFEKADRALYRAKAEGRDRVVVWQE
jgi:diguanylate cyclase (GGDEF)-like protein